MSLSDLRKSQARKVLGIDASTASVAFCLIEDGKITKIGKLPIEGMTIYDKIKDAGTKAKALKKVTGAEYIAIEQAIMVRSADAGLKIAMIVGALLTNLLDKNTEVVTITPIQWQSFIGNNNFTKAMKEEMKSLHPGKGEAFIKARIRDVRKQKTMDFFKKYGVEVDDNDVGDACGIAYYVYKNRVK
jgi:Holliday junction resolvasome RuvABC endonuclease subunit